ncbi:hypothetical protein SAMN05660293_03255 [Dyadobacter psychrophilus]|uniref:Sulfite dehydrogenase (Cytochrome) subunit SorB n=1 Tax=Dyadobacter psychrophilus TaxID=651661 RepID=A0A1T5FNU6_9BACT|nr:hypothetical protein SAMN05660293_03255 [Dyadobacter psychrophilus]
MLLCLLLFAGLVSTAFRSETGVGNNAGWVSMPLDTTKTDKETGLVTDPNLYMVKAQCTSCHSSKLIIANRFTRDGWKQKIRWMQANHNLWDLGETEKQVLDYLEKHYAPTVTAARRKPLNDIKWYKLEE